MTGAVVMRRTDVIDGDQWQAWCPRCRWESEPSTNPTVARMRATTHNNEEHP